MVDACEFAAPQAIDPSMNCSSQAMLFRGFREDRRNSMEVYADNLIEHLNRLSKSQVTIGEFRPQVSSVMSRLPDYANLRMRLCRYVSFPRQARRVPVNVSHVLDHGYAHLLQVLKPRATVLTVHDVIPILSGRRGIHGTKLNGRRWLSEWSARYYKRAHRIIATSESTKRDLVEHCECDSERISVVYPGINSTFVPDQESEKQGHRKSLGLPPIGVNLVLITGQEFYKNQTTSLRVMEALRERYGDSIWLVRLGRGSPEWEREVEQSSVRKQISYLEDLPSDKMVHLYNAVDCLLFPSWYEGFGLPPAEAMACGVPVVTSRVASLPEVVGDAGLMVSPDDVSGLVDAIAALLDNHDFRQSQIQKGLIQARRFDWGRNADSTMAIYEEMMSGQ
jgi:glycosyltransferase involved in cell wall biosynthesis